MTSSKKNVKKTVTKSVAKSVSKAAKGILKQASKFKPALVKLEKKLENKVKESIGKTAKSKRTVTDGSAQNSVFEKKNEKIIGIKESKKKLEKEREPSLQKKQNAKSDKQNSRITPKTEKLKEKNFTASKNIVPKRKSVTQEKKTLEAGSLKTNQKINSKLRSIKPIKKRSEEIQSVSSKNGGSSLILMPRDAESFFAHWEIAPLEKENGIAEEQKQKFETYSTAIKLVWPGPNGGTLFHYHQVGLDHGKTYIPRPSPALQFAAKLGWLSENGHFVTLAASRPIEMPEIWEGTLARFQQSSQNSHSEPSTQKPGSSGKTTKKGSKNASDQTFAQGWQYSALNLLGANGKTLSSAEFHDWTSRLASAWNQMSSWNLSSWPISSFVTVQNFWNFLGSSEKLAINISSFTKALGLGSSQSYNHALPYEFLISELILFRALGSSWKGLASSEWNVLASLFSSSGASEVFFSASSIVKNLFIQNVSSLGGSSNWMAGSSWGGSSRLGGSSSPGGVLTGSSRSALNNRELQEKAWEMDWRMNSGEAQTSSSEVQEKNTSKATWSNQSGLPQNNTLRVTNTSLGSTLLDLGHLGDKLQYVYLNGQRLAVNSQSQVVFKNRVTSTSLKLEMAWKEGTTSYWTVDTV